MRSTLTRFIVIISRKHNFEEPACVGATTLQRDSHVTTQFTQSWMLIAFVSIASYTHSSDSNEIFASGKNILSANISKEEEDVYD